MNWKEMTTVADYAAEALCYIARAQATTRAKWKRALPKLQKAVLETQLYVASLDREESIDRKEERRLVKLWRTAAARFYTLDGELAERLQLKAESGHSQRHGLANKFGTQGSLYSTLRNTQDNFFTRQVTRHPLFYGKLPRSNKFFLGHPARGAYSFAFPMFRGPRSAPAPAQRRS